MNLIFVFLLYFKIQHNTVHNSIIQITTYTVTITHSNEDLPTYKLHTPERNTWSFKISSQVRLRPFNFWPSKHWLSNIFPFVQINYNCSFNEEYNYPFPTVSSHDSMYDYLRSFSPSSVFTKAWFPNIQWAAFVYLLKINHLKVQICVLNITTSIQLHFR